MEPLVSIIIPVRNRYEILGETLNSVINQTYQNWECLIINDGSWDYSMELCQYYIEKDNRFKSQYLHHINSPAKVRNFGLLKSKGEFIQFLDSDDIISPNKIQSQVEYLLKNTTYDLVTCKWKRFSKDSIEMYDLPQLKSFNCFTNMPLFFKALSESFGYFPIHAYLISKKLIYRIGFWNEDLKINDDTEFINRCLLNVNSVGFVATGFAFYRVNTQNNISQLQDYNDLEKAIFAWKIISFRFKLRFGEDIPYILKEKQKIFDRIKNIHPKLIKENREFFSHNIKLEERKNCFIWRLMRKINYLKSW